MQFCEKKAAEPKKIALRVPMEDYEAFRQIVKIYRISVQEGIRQLVRKAIEEQGQCEQFTTGSCTDNFHAR